MKLILLKVDKYWPVASSSIKTEVKYRIMIMKFLDMKFNFNVSLSSEECICLNLICCVQVKDEPMDIVEDAEWDRAAEAEILAANEGFNEELDVEVEVEKKVVVEKNAKTSRPKRLRKPKMRENFETNPDEPDEMSESERFDDEEDFSVSDDDDDDPSFKNSHSDDSEGDDDSLNSLDMFGKFDFSQYSSC